MKCKKRPLPSHFSVASQIYLHWGNDAHASLRMTGDIKFSKQQPVGGYIANYKVPTNWEYNFHASDASFSFEGYFSNSELTDPNAQQYPIGTLSLPWEWWVSVVTITANPQQFPQFNGYQSVTGNCHAQAGGGNTHSSGPYWNLENNENFLPTQIQLAIVGHGGPTGTQQLARLYVFLCRSVPCNSRRRD